MRLGDFLGGRMLRSSKLSIRRKLMLLVAATTLAALCLTGAAMVAYDLRSYQQTWANDLATQAEILGRASTAAIAFDDRKVAAENLGLLSTRPKITAAAIYAAKGELFATYARPDLPNAGFPASPELDGYRIEGGQLVLFRRIADSTGTLGTVYLRGEYEPFQRLAGFLAILGVVIALSLLVAVWMSSWLQAAVTDPILEITHVAQQVMDRRDFSLRATKTTADEIGFLVDTFNDMLAEVGQRARALEESNRLLEHEMEERHGAEKALIAADRLKDEFLATLAHELRNPLAPMRNSLELLRLSGDDANSARKAREVMERQLRQLVRLVDDLLDVSRITTGKLQLQREQVELRAIVQRAVETVGPLIAARNLTLSLELPAEPIHLYADPTRLAQVFINLLNNAAKFTSGPGEIALRAERGAGDVVVTVTDRGVGIPIDMLASIFEMFVQVDRTLEREQAGLGVGLSLARFLIDLHGGSISASSDGPGRGSRFTVRLPTVESPATDAAAAQAQAAEHGASQRILLADDNVDFAASMALILEAMGHEVRVANDGEEALAAAASFKPRFAFLDIGLPKLSGYDLARRLRASPETSRCVLVAVTGWGQEDDKRRAREAGFDHHLVKPVEPDRIEAIIDGAR